MSNYLVTKIISMTYTYKLYTHNAFDKYIIIANLPFSTRLISRLHRLCARALPLHV